MVLRQRLVTFNNEMTSPLSEDSSICN